MGKLISLTSLDNGGKSTQTQLIKKYLEQNNVKCVSIHFPMCETYESGKIIAAYLRGEYGKLEEVDPIFVANMYAMNRYQYLPILKKQLIENDVVLLDRYVFCNMAYQGAKYNTNAQSQIMIDWINEFEYGFLELPYPDLTIFFDVSIETIKNRMLIEREGKDREYLKGKTDIHENDIKYQEKVRENYLALTSYQGYHIIETGDLLPEDIFKKYENILVKTLTI
jgi:dTMP kinase